MALAFNGRGGAAFNGGTVTGATTFAPAHPNDVAVSLRPPTGATATYKPEANLYDDAGNLIGQIDAAGNWNIVLNPAYFSAFAVYEGTDLNTALLRVEIDSAGRGIILNAGPGGGSIDLAVQAANGSAHTAIHVQSAGNDDVTPAIGFFGHQASAKPTVSGAKLPSDDVMASLLAALDGMGLITDSTT